MTIVTVASRYRLWASEDGCLWFCVKERGGWTVCYRLRARERRPIVVEMRVVPTPPGEIVHVRDDKEPQGHHEPPGDGLTAGIIDARLTLGKHVYGALPRVLRDARKSAIGPYLTLVVEQMLASLGLDPTLAPKRGRRGPRADLVRAARIAADYVDACEAGSRSPALDAARAHRMSPEAVRATLRRARTRDALLTRQTAGRAGGELTPRAVAILREHERS